MRFWADFTPFDLGSDHQVYESSYHIPALYLRDSPDIYIHTDGDRPANMDTTKLRRVAVLGAASAYFIASLDDREAKPLAAEVFARGGKRQSEALRLALMEPDAKEALNLVTEAARQERETLASIEPFAPQQKPLLDNLIEQVNARYSQAKLVLAVYGKEAVEVRESAHGRLVPRRNPEVVGLLSVGGGVYAPGGREGRGSANPTPTGRLENSGIITYDALNLVDGHRSIAGIRDILSANYGSVSEDFIYQYFKQLQEQKIVSGSVVIHQLLTLNGWQTALHREHTWPVCSEK